MESKINCYQHIDRANQEQQLQKNNQNADLQVKQEDLQDIDGQCNQFNNNQHLQYFFNTYCYFDMNFQVNELVLSSINNHNTQQANQLLNKIEQSNIQGDQSIKRSQLNIGKQNEEQIKIEEQSQDIDNQIDNINDTESKQIKILHEIVKEKCNKYQKIYINFKQLHRQMKDNQSISNVVNEIRNLIISHYKELKSMKKLQIHQRKNRKNIKNYSNEQFHCMCSLDARFTKLSSLHNHIKKHHEDTPVWCWQAKLSFQVGRPNKEIPELEIIQKPKKLRYDQRVKKLLQMHSQQQK